MISRLIAFFMMGLAVVQLGQIISVLSWFEYVVSDKTVVLLVDILCSILWEVVFLAGTGAIWYGFPWALRRTFWVCAGFMLYNVARWVVFTKADYDRGRLPFLIVSVGSILAIMMIFRRYSDGKPRMEKQTNDGKLQNLRPPRTARH